jgi:hypothetical protein
VDLFDYINLSPFLVLVVKTASTCLEKNHGDGSGIFGTP